MSIWKGIFEKDLFEIRSIKYNKLNVIIQNIANLLQKEGLTKIEVELINLAIANKAALNPVNAESFYRNRWESLLTRERLDEVSQIQERDVLIKELLSCFDYLDKSGLPLFTIKDSGVIEKAKKIVGEK